MFKLLQSLISLSNRDALTEMWRQLAVKERSCYERTYDKIRLHW